MSNTTDIITQDLSVLRQKSDPVETAGEAEDLIERLKKVLNKTPNGVGLSAIQIGISKRVSIIRWPTSDTEFEWLYLINPTFEKLENEVVHMGEGCLSYPSTYHDVVRYKDTIIKNFKIADGELVSERLYFFYRDSWDKPRMTPPIVAIAVQHEIDHMDGVLFIDKIAEKPKMLVSKKVGRNDPCPCDSGKKYKKCCGK